MIAHRKTCYIAISGDLDALYEFAGRYAQGASQLDDVSQPHIALAPLDPANVIAVQVRLLGKAFLRQPAAAPQGRYSTAEPDLLRITRHKRTLRLCTLSVLHTMSITRPILKQTPLDDREWSTRSLEGLA